MTIHLPTWLPLTLLNVAVLAGLTVYVRRRLASLRRPTRLWVVGEFRGTTKRGHIIWGLMGIFEDRSRAVAECKGKAFFLAPVEVDTPIPADGAGMPKCEYPHLKEANHGA